MKRGKKLRAGRATKALQKRRLLLESLEARCVLAGDVYDQVSPNWFTRLPQAPGFSSAEIGESSAEWVVRLSKPMLDSVQATGPADAAKLLNPPTVWPAGQVGIGFDVLGGLGLPGQLLVRTNGNDIAAVEAAFASNPAVAEFTHNASATGLATPNDASFNSQWHLRNNSQNGGQPDADIDADEAWDVTTGNRNTVVALVDSGIDLTHPDLYENVWLNQGEIPPAIRAQVVDHDGDGIISLVDLNASANAGIVTDRPGVGAGYIDARDVLGDPDWSDGLDNDDSGKADDLFGWDFVNDDNDPFDDHGHGTHVAGILGARGNNSAGVTGVAWQTSMLPLKFLDSANSGTLDDAIAAINYATLLKTLGANVRISNNSWGVSGGSGDIGLRSAIESAGAENILVVAGAGNGDVLGRGINIEDTPLYPASFDLPNVLSVAASDNQDQLARFSNFGVQSVDIVAPGQGILSTEPGGGYGTRNGTSMATPQVSGVAALVLAAHPYASLEELRQAVLQGADRMPQFSGLVESSARLNANKAVRSSSFAPRASLVATADVTAPSAAAKTFSITYTDSNDVQVASLDDAVVSQDIFVTRVGFSATQLQPQYVSIDQRINGPTRTVTYALSPPGGSWDAIDSGVYEVHLRGDEVRDVTGLAAQARVIGSFRVQIADANIFFVNTTVDSVDALPGDGLAVDASGRTSFRAAVQEANALSGRQTIVIPEGRYQLTVDAVTALEEDLSAEGDIDILGDTVIIGAGMGETILDAFTLTGTHQERVLDIRSGADVSLQSVSITGGHAEAGGGAGIRNFGDLTALQTHISFNYSAEKGAGIGNFGTLALDRVWIDSNFISGLGDFGGAGIYTSGPLQVTASTISNNKTANGALGGGGGAGIFVDNTGSLTISDSTLSGNEANVSFGGGMFLRGNASLQNLTITNNYGDDGGGGIYVDRTGTGTPQLQIGNSIVAGNRSAFGSKDVFAEQSQGVQSLGYNHFGVILSDDGFSGIRRATDKSGTAATPLDPQLGPLTPAKGKIPVHLPIKGSRVINVGNPAVTTNDQLGNTRPAGAAPDIGAVERFDAQISGRVLRDSNGNGIAEANEPGLAGVKVFLDLNENNRADPGEPFAFTSADDPGTATTVETGLISFLTNPGPYRVGIEAPPGYEVSKHHSLLPSSQITLERRFDTQTSIPGLDHGTLTKIYYAMQDRERTVISAETDSLFPDTNLAGAGLILLNSIGKATPLATLASGTTFNPDTADSFDTVEDLVNEAWFAFVLKPGNGTGRPGGVYVVSTTGELRTLANGTTVVPDFDDETTFDPNLFGAATTVNGFTGFHTEPVSDYQTYAFVGKFTADLFGQNTYIPFFTTVTSIIDSTGDQTGLAFIANRGSGRTRIYYTDGNSVHTVADEFRSIPNGTGTFLPYDATRKTRLSMSGSEVVFRGFGSGGQEGIYLDDYEGTLWSIADKKSFVPESPTGSKFTSFHPNVAIEDGIVVFSGYAENQQQGIYASILDEEGVAHLRKIVEAHDLLDGKPLDLSRSGGPLVMSRDAISKNRIAFTAYFADGTQAVYVAKIEPIAFIERTLTVGDEYAGLDFLLKPKLGSIQGAVFEDISGDGSQNSEELGPLDYQNYKVFLDKDGDGVQDAGEVVGVDAQGNYEFSDLPTDRSYNVTVIMPSGIVATSPVGTPGRRTLLVGPGEHVQGISFGTRVNAAGSGVGQVSGVLTGFVYADANANGQKDPLELGMGNQSVYLDLNNNGTREAATEPLAITAADGSYQLATPPDSVGRSFAVRVLPAAQQVQTSPKTNEFVAAPADVLATGTSPQGVATGDFNFDGLPDLAMVDGQSNQVRLYYNVNGTSFVAGPTIGGLDSPIALVSGDFDGDGNRDDLAVANYSSHSVSLLLNSGDGSQQAAFAAPLSFAVGSAPRALAVGRINGDALDDLAVANELSNSVSILTQNGGAGPRFSVTQTVATGRSPRGIVLADLNNDDVVDLAVTNAFDRNVKGYRNVAGAFTGAEATLAVGSGPLGITAGDVTGDGLRDLIVANLGSNTVSVLQNTFTAGALTFQATATNLPAGTGPQSVHVIDIDQDGDQDIAVSNGTDKNLSLLRNRITPSQAAGSVLFAPAELVGITQLSGGQGFALASADFDGDQDQDLVIARSGKATISGGSSGNVAIFRNTIFSAGAQLAALQTNGQVVSELNFGFTRINVPPTIDLLAPLTIDEDAPEQSVEVTGLSPGLGDEGQTFQVTLGAVAPGSLFANVVLDHSSGANTAALRFTPANHQFGAGEITVTIRDAGTDGVLSTGDDGVVSRVLQVTVRPVNDPPPHADDDFVVLPNSGNVILDVLANDKPNPDGASEQLTIVFTPSLPAAQGTISRNAERTHLIFTPAPGFSGVIQTTYTVGDGATTEEANLTIRVTSGGQIQQNVNDRFDVDANEVVDINDAVAVIRALRRKNSGVDFSQGASPPYYDVTGDGQLTLTDAVEVIRELRRRR